MITAEARRSTLLTLYPLFKAEVYRRRQEMMRWTAFGSAGLIAMLVALTLNQHKDRLTSVETLLVGLASLIWCGLSCALIRQQQHRHRQAKQVLIHLEQALELYEQGIFMENRTLYPEAWTSDWMSDRTGILYFTTLGSLTVIFLIALLMA
ncbi:hypothetical protein ACO9S2_16955 [Nitrospira sp. NS4]|uniref:hypothetical protein n=1 Tax=Nitrospira sp. NS4 TaxID=3414498 RepID=UPI003C30D021